MRYRKISTDEVVNAVKCTNLTLIERNFGIEGFYCGDALTAIAYYENKEKGKTLDMITTILNSILEGENPQCESDVKELFGQNMNISYFLGFSSGYDDQPPVDFISDYHFREGYKDGKTVRAELQTLKIPVYTEMDIFGMALTNPAPMILSVLIQETEAGGVE